MTDLPDLELELVDDDTVGEAVQVSVSGRRVWPIFVGAAMVAGALWFTGSSSGQSALPQPQRPPQTTTPSTIEPSTTPVKPARPSVRGLTVLPTAERDGVILSTSRGAFTLRTDSSLGSVVDVVSVNSGLAVSFAGGTARSYTRQRSDGVDLGPAERLYPTDDRASVWAQTEFLGKDVVRRVELTGTSGPASLVPTDARVVGSAGAQLVLAGPDQGPLELWDPVVDVRTPITSQGEFVASTAGQVAWVEGRRLHVTSTATGQDLLVLRIDGRLQPGSTFSADGTHLAVASLIPQRAPPERSRVLVVDLSDGSTERIVNREIRSLSWGTDGVLMWVGPFDIVTTWRPLEGEIDSFQPMLPA